MKGKSNMKYENAKDILPKHLLEEVQKYAARKIIYVTRKEGQKGWGEASGYRNRLEKRNAMIRQMYSAGKTVLEIAEEFFLSPETIKKIVYGKKVTLPEYSPSVHSAEQYANAGMGEEWLRNFMTINNMEKPDFTECFVTGVVRIPLRLIRLGRGTAEQTIVGCGDEPLVVWFDGREFTVPYQEEQIKALKEAKRNSYAAFIIVDNKDYGFFWNNYGKHFQR